jgi:hypothetical protein
MTLSYASLDLDSRTLDIFLDASTLTILTTSILQPINHININHKSSSLTLTMNPSLLLGIITKRQVTLPSLPHSTLHITRDKEEIGSNKV